MKNITFINAGAGSGKTYRLTTDLARMLTQEGLEPSQVILTTYTELAAAEFREKARREILNAKDKEGNPIAATQRINSATQLDNAFIGTVHSISFRFIRRYWYLLGYGADIQPMSDQNQDFYMSQSISSIVTEAHRRVFHEFRETFDIKDVNKPYHLFWLPELKAIVDKMEYYDIKDVKESIAKSKEIANTVFHGMSISEALQHINDYLPLLKARCEGLLTGRSAAKAQRIIDTIVNVGKIRSISDLRTEEMKECLEGTIGNSTDTFYSNPLYLSAKRAYEETFISKDFLPIINEYLDNIFDLACSWQQELITYKQENHIISFDDMEKIFLSMLTEPQYKEVQDDIASNFRLLMVDEFQDSNPIQLKIFNRISELIAQNGGHSIWVGDPKQAIYGFRGSDSRFISEILSKFNFSDDGTAISEQGEDKLGTDQLLQSWRSRPALVEFSNNIFLDPFKKGGLKEKQIILEAHHTPQTDTLGNEQALYIWRTEQQTSQPRARMLAHQIKALLESKKRVHHQECDKPTSVITYRDIAVLCFSNNECNNVASQLRKLGLPVSCEETDLMQCLEVYLVKTLLLFMQNPSDKMLRAELAIMLNNSTTEEILRDRICYVNEKASEDKGWDHWLDADYESDHSKIIDRLTKITSRYENLSVYDGVVAICEELDIANIIEKWGNPTQRRHNLSTVVNMAKAYDDMCQQMGIGSSITGFINYLSITKPDNKTDNSANTIKVLTYHRSKGLEWPVVILYQLWKEFDKDSDLAKDKFRGVNVCECSDQDVDIFHRMHYISFFPTGIGGNGNLPSLMEEKVVSQPLFRSIKEQTMEEALRLLYVGVTRAKDYLVSITSKKKTNEGGDYPSTWPMSLGIGDGSSKALFGSGYSGELVELTESLYGDRDEQKTPQYQQTTNVPGINSAPMLVLSPSTISDFNNPFTRNEQVVEAEERIIDWNMFAGEQSDAVKGSCIHNIFAAYRPGDQKGNIDRATQTLTGYGFPNVLLKQKEKVLESIKWLHDYLTQAYGPATHIEKEYPLLFPLPTGQMLHGEIDLLWYYLADDGKEKCVLVDYKTFPGKRDQLETHTEKYYAQLSAYHSALTESGVTVVDTLIYYPVQAHLRKLLK